ncbi:hypothetical protein JCM33374_g1605 [Metschnikowia sp. JCM 33374]|nr:hypothetical protein JCM33374_g1605 [Metschnikowia sp. JCM 33374]
MKFIDEVDIELVNQELNFQSPDNNLIIKGGCDLFTTKAIGSDRKLFKTIDKHLDQIMEDQQLSQSIERERKQSVNSLFGSSASPQQPHFMRRGSLTNESFDRERTLTNLSLSFNKSDETLAEKNHVFKNISSPIVEENSEEFAVDESPFGPLKNASTRKTFAYLIAILNTTYPDHDFSNLQPSTENFYRIESSESLRHRFNSIMISLGKKEDLLSWVWDTINAYMDLIPSRSPTLAAQGGTNSRKNSFNGTGQAGSPGHLDPGIFSNDSTCKIYEFQPSDQSILEDLHHPYQTLWSNYWFIYNKKKKRVCFLYLTAINRGHYSQINRTRTPPVGHESRDSTRQRSRNDDESYDDEYDDHMDDASMDGDDDALNDDVIGDIEI